MTWITYSWAARVELHFKSEKLSGQTSVTMEICEEYSNTAEWQHDTSPPKTCGIHQPSATMTLMTDTHFNPFFLKDILRLIHKCRSCQQVAELSQQTSYTPTLRKLAALSRWQVFVADGNIEDWFYSVFQNEWSKRKRAWHHWTGHPWRGHQADATCSY